MRTIRKNKDGSCTILLHLKEEEIQRVKQLSKSMEMNDFEVIKYCLRLVSWWSRNEIEPEES